jgi:hypothetical protein
VVRSLPLLVAVVVLAGALAGCGSSRPKGVNFHSTSRHYTVTQVEAAFAAQGIQLRLAHEQFPGYEVLHGGQKHLLTVLVALSAGQAVPTGYGTNGDRTQRNGNVRVSFDPANAKPVESALARLH